MRHDLFLPRPISASACRMCEPAPPAGLVASPGSPQRRLPRLAGAAASAIDLAAVAAAADQHLRPAAGAQEHPASVGHRRFGVKAEARWTPRASDAILSVARTSSRSPRVGRDDGVTCQVLTVVALALSSARRLSGHESLQGHRSGDRPSGTRFGMQLRAAGLQASGPAGRQRPTRITTPTSPALHRHRAERKDLVKLRGKYPRFLTGNYTRSLADQVQASAVRPWRK